MTNSKVLPTEFGKNLTDIVAQDRGKRGVSTLCRAEYWCEASELFAGMSKVAVVSGFYVPRAKAPETDGPCGAVILARAFHRQNIQSEIWTDYLCEESMKECASAVGLPEECVKTVDEKNILDKFCPDGVIFTERLGRASDGGYYNFRKNEISSYTPPLDSISDKAQIKGIKTIGIGDGGNEAGMGNFFDELSVLLPEYRQCLSVVKTDIALPVDVSNWGCYALTSALSHIWGIWRGHEEGDEQKMLEALVRSKAVDGISGKSELSVDGFAIDIQNEVIRQIHDVWKKFF